MKIGRRYIKVTERRIHYYKISQVSKRLGITPRTIRFYEQYGLLPASRRTKGRMRLFLEDEINLIQKIRTLQEEKKLSLAEIKAQMVHDHKTIQSQKEKTKIKIVVDSACSLPVTLLKHYGIEVIPMKLFYGKTVFDDLENFHNKDLLHALTEGRHPLRTSPPDYEDMVSFYNNLYERGAEKIISIHLSSGLSNMIKTVKKAALYMNALVDIQVIDSQCFSLGAGLMAVEAGRLLAEGKTDEHVIQRLHELSGNVKEFFGADSLRHILRKRMDTYSLGMMLDFKPIFTTEHGKLKLLSRVNTTQEIIDFLLNTATPASSIGIMHGLLKTEADHLSSLLISQKKKMITQTEISTIPGVYFGPYTLGIAFYL